VNELRVQCHAGYRADERPVRFTLRGRDFQVNEIDGQWYTPEAKYFRVVAEDGNFYVLCHDEVQDSWTLSAHLANSGKRSAPRNPHSPTANRPRGA
jgi:hypothetical protein